MTQCGFYWNVFKVFDPKVQLRRSPFLPYLTPLPPIPCTPPTPTPARVCDNMMLRCQNGGVCHGNLRCQCPPGFSGLLCEKLRCEGEPGGCGEGSISGHAAPIGCCCPGPLISLALLVCTLLPRARLDAELWAGSGTRQQGRKGEKKKTDNRNDVMGGTQQGTSRKKCERPF